MAVASSKEEKRIFDSKIIESYCKAKYGSIIVNAMGRTKEQEEISLKEQEEKNPSWLHIYKVLPVGEYKPLWKHQYDILIQVGLPEKLLIELRENRLSDLLDS
jgi:hypothetical protein